MAGKFTVVLKHFRGNLLPWCLNSLAYQQPAPAKIILIIPEALTKDIKTIQTKFPSVQIITVNESRSVEDAEKLAASASVGSSIITINTDNVQASAQPAAVNSSVNSLQSENAELKEKLRSTEAGFRDLQDRFGRTSKRLKEKTSAVSDLTSENGMLEGRIRNLEQQMERLQAGVVAPVETVQEMKADSPDSRDLERKLKEAEALLEKESRKVKNLQRVVKELKAANGSSDDGNNVISDYKAKIEELEFNLQKKEREFSETIFEKQSELDTSLDRVAELMVEVSRGKSEIKSGSDAVKENGNLKERIKVLENTLAETRKKLQAETDEKERIIADSATLVAELVENISDLTVRLKDIEHDSYRIEDFKDIATGLEKRLHETELRYEADMGEKERELKAARKKIKELEQQSETPAPARTEEPEETVSNNDSYGAESGSGFGDNNPSEKAADGEDNEPASAGAAENRYNNDVTCESIIEEIYDNPSPESFMKLRDFFTSNERFPEGVKVLTNMFAGLPRDDLIPAVSLLIGELHMKCGNDEEANYYLSNPLISKDAISAAILEKIEIELPSPIPE